VAAQVWPLLALVAVLLLASLAWLFSSGDYATARVAWALFRTATLGLVGSFALHESAHVLVLKQVRTVTHVTIDRTAWRTSILPSGVLTGRQVVGVAIAGPFACVAVGLALWTTDLGSSLRWWYLAHGIFLLPIFGDGRSLCRGLRGHGLRSG
jgi:hypothetical protein